MFYYSPGNGQSVKGAGSPSDFIQYQKTVSGGIAQDVGHLCHFHHKGALSAGQIVGSPHPGKNTVAYADISLLGRHKAAQLGHKHNQGHLAHVRGFTRHVGAGDNGQPVLSIVQKGVVGHKHVVPHHLLHHGMAAVLNLNHTLVVDGGLHIVAPGCHHGQGTEHVDSSYGLGRLLNADDLCPDFVPDLAEQVILQGHQLFLRAHDDVFQLL